MGLDLGVALLLMSLVYLTYIDFLFDLLYNISRAVARRYEQFTLLGKKVMGSTPICQSIIVYCILADETIKKWKQQQIDSYRRGEEYKKKNRVNRL